jgi:hypothetical protein
MDSLQLGTYEISNVGYNEACTLLEFVPIALVLSNEFI